MATFGGTTEIQKEIIARGLGLTSPSTKPVLPISSTMLDKELETGPHGQIHARQCCTLQCGVSWPGRCWRLGRRCLDPCRARPCRQRGITDYPVTTMTVTCCDGRDSTDVRYPPNALNRCPRYGLLDARITVLSERRQRPRQSSALSSAVPSVG